MFIDAVHMHDEIVVWIRDEDGKLIEFRDDAPYYAYELDENGDYLTIFKKKAKKITFRDRKSYNRYIHNNDNLYESDISPLHKYLSDNFYKTPNTSLNVGFLDIETDFDLSNGNGYPTVENPFGIINAVTLYSRHKQKFYQYYVSSTSVTIDPGIDIIESVACVSERQLIDNLINTIETDDLDILSGWHSNGFDIPYLIERMRILYGNKQSLLKLCRNGFQAHVVTRKDKWDNERTQYDLVGRVHLDMMELYEKFTFIEQPSMKLENIAQVELGYGKIDYDGDLGELYRTDLKRFLEYNIHDVRLLRDLDKKLKFIDLAIQMARESTIRIHEVLGTLKFLDRSIRNYAHYDREVPIILPSNSAGIKDDKFIGAWVADPIKGRFKWSSSIDLRSLYPSIIRSISMSPETFIFQCEGRESDFLKYAQGESGDVNLISKLTNERISVSLDDLREMIVENGFTISANGSIFDGTVGLIPEILGIWFDTRVEFKSIAENAFEIGDVATGAFYHSKQHIQKIKLNSVYGVLSNAYFRFFDLDIAKSVTLTGQYINKFQAWSSDTYLKRLQNV